ncbi:DUF6141 family protein [Aquibacillus koreensis]|uniref:DUF6141 family protein n=1 Tax=Aquibacillus koreensis TaxID=279446 RepID=A0A9X3WH55_9BACI|nr:DUF6141 family protein [Aquibacillus koreensis]MCT2534718.1 DUF6141 family protein [Aquibacillus koreensis]MDC3419672.1 DUF6141 family protein [Aquibacillus koreensis]
MEKQNKVIFREIQKPRSMLLWIFISVFTFSMWYIFIQQIILGKPVGTKPAPNVFLIILWVFFSVIVPIILLFFTKLIIEVREEGLYIRYMPFHFRYKQFLFKEIKHYQSINYSPLKRFGGWGIRLNVNGEKAYNMDGNKAIELGMKGQTLVIGTRKPEEFKNAIDSLKKGL